MATLKDINYALKGEGQSAQEKLGKDVAGIVTYEKPVEQKEWYVFKLVNSNKKGGVYIPNIDDVVNPTTGKVERIRLLSGIDSIWVKDQMDVTPEYVRTNSRNIEFPRGVKIRRVPAHDHTMLEFMRVTNCNVGNPKRVRATRFEFYEYDFAAAEKEAFEREEFELEMALIAKKEPEASMKKHAAFLGIRMVNDLGEPKTADGIRREYVMYAKRNPDYFKKTHNTPQLEISWLVRRAISEGMIEIGREPGKIYWAKNGGMICAIPQGEKPQEYLTALAQMNTEEGTRFKEQLQKTQS